MNSSLKIFVHLYDNLELLLNNNLSNSITRSKFLGQRVGTFLRISIHILTSFLIYGIDFYSLPRVWRFSDKTMISFGSVITTTSSLLLVIIALLLNTQILSILCFFFFLHCQRFVSVIAFFVCLFITHKDSTLRFIDYNIFNFLLSLVSYFYC